MKRIKVSQALMFPFFFIITLVLIVFLILWRTDYNWLKEEQGKKILEVTIENIEVKLDKLLLEPFKIGEIFVNQNKLANIFEDNNMVELEKYILSYIDSIKHDMPQISSIGYGNEEGNYVAFRINDDESLNLMLKDNKKEDGLLIYDGITIDSNVIKKFENYDPRVRPWYIPVKKERKSMWSDVYTNYDEKMESTITALIPVLSNDEFKGTVGIDIKLNGINKFLKDIKNYEGGVSYIVDSKWNLIASSEEILIGENNVNANKLLTTENVKNQIIIDSSRALKDNEEIEDQIIIKKFGIEKNLLYMSKIKGLKELDWRIIIIMNEKEVVGNLSKRQNLTMVIVSITIIILSLFGVFILKKITKPIIESTKIAEKISNGEFDEINEENNYFLDETYYLIDAFNSMSKNLKNLFNKLTLSEKKYRVLVENIDQIIFSIDINGYFVAINKSFQTKFMIDRENLIGYKIEKLLDNDTKLVIIINLFKKIIGGSEKEVSKYDYVKNSETKSIYFTALPIKNEENDLQMVLFSGVDITELLKAQKEIERLHQREKKSLQKRLIERDEEVEILMKELINREKMASLGSLVSGIAHEINTPLGISVSAVSLMEKTNNDIVDSLENGKMTKQMFIEYIEMMDESFNILSNNLNRASKLVMNFKALAVNQSAEIKVKFNVRDNIESVITSLKHEWKNKGIKINLVCEDNLVIYSYPGAFAQIITNLILNSIIHGFKKRSEGIIEMKIIKKGGRLIFIYADDGNGMNKKVVKHVFEPFYTTNRINGGSGLGMNIVYNLVTEKLKGKISCESIVEKGTKFIMEFDELEVK